MGIMGEMVKNGQVAPHAGAWIETIVFITEDFVPSASHPTRVRGLKHV